MNEEMNWQDRSPLSDKRRINEEIDVVNDGKNEKANDEDSKEDHDGIIIACDFFLNYAGGTMRNSW